MNANKFYPEIVTWQPAQYDIRLVRNPAFVDEPGIPSALEWGRTDTGYFYVIARDSAGNPEGTGRIGNDGHLGRMAVLPAFRAKGIGGDILKKLPQIAVCNKLNKFWLNAQSGVTAFYAEYGFGPIGNNFEQASISHIKMKLQLHNS